ncbi:MAG TPA: transposase [Thermoanaerobacterales bacterium]|jgi:transposase-like protein|nr:transposase [Thermoanaerobacterales bacterium]
MTTKQYSEEFKEQPIKESQEVGNIALVARRYDISPATIYTNKCSQPIIYDKNSPFPFFHIP